MTPKNEAEAVNQYKPYVIKTARYFKTSSVSEEDLIQEGLIAVALAFREWRSDGGANFLTWIRRPVYHAMLRIVKEQRRAGGSFRGSNRGDGEYVENVVSVVSLDKSTHVVRIDPNHSWGYSSDERDLTLHERVGTTPEMPDWFALERLPECVSALEPRERKVIRLRFEDGLTHAAVGRKLKVSREFARQIEAKALGKLKAMMSKEVGA